VRVRVRVRVRMRARVRVRVRVLERVLVRVHVRVHVCVCVCEMCVSLCVRAHVPCQYTFLHVLFFVNICRKCSGANGVCIFMLICALTHHWSKLNNQLGAEKMPLEKTQKNFLILLLSFASAFCGGVLVQVEGRSEKTVWLGRQGGNAGSYRILSRLPVLQLRGGGGEGGGAPGFVLGLITVWGGGG